MSWSKADIPIKTKATPKDGPHMSLLPELPELALKHWVIYFFRLRASTNPAAPIPINASVPGSGTAAILPPVSPGGLFLQAGKSGFW